MSLTDEIENRQESLELQTYSDAIIVGVGGIGSWVALMLGLSGQVSNLILIDPDIVESSNLNRTPFGIKDIGAPKVEAVKYLILERRVDIDIDIIQSKTNDVVKSKILELLHAPNPVIVDCRDDVYKDLYDIPARLYYKVGYDGLDITIDGDPENTPVWGEGTGYRVIPSYVGSALLAACLVVNDILIDYYDEDSDEYREFNYKTNDEGKLNCPLTFSVPDILDSISKCVGS